MNIEQRLREKEKMVTNIYQPHTTNIPYENYVILISDALQICNEAIAEAKKDGILLLAKHLFSKVDTKTWNEVIAKILDKHSIKFMGD